MEDNNDDSNGLTGIKPEDLLSHIDGIPLPPALKKNLWKAIGQLITGAVNVPVAWLDGKSRIIKADADAKILMTKKTSEIAARQFGREPALIDRAIAFHGASLLREQRNREVVIAQTIAEFKENPPKSETHEDEIDADWLQMFSKVAESKSNADVQIFLSKILAGEIRRPGSFTPQTIQILSLLDQSTAKVFQKIANLSFVFSAGTSHFRVVITSPFGDPNENKLKIFGLPYIALTHLADIGLIKYDLRAWYELSKTNFSKPVHIGGKLYKLIPTEETSIEKTRVNIINFTTAGNQLLNVMQSLPDDVYNEGLIAYLLTKFHLKLEG